MNELIAQLEALNPAELREVADRIPMSKAPIPVQFCWAKYGILSHVEIPASPVEPAKADQP